MQVTETLSEGLKRELKIVVPASELDSKLQTRLTELKDRVRLNGFRPGKVPVAHLRKVYGKSVMAEIVQETITNTSRSTLEERNEKSAIQPDYKMTEDEAEADKILDGQADLEFSMAYEILPAIEIGDFSSITIERPIAEVTDEDMDARINQIADGSRSYDAKDGAAEDGDQVHMSYLGKVDGEAFPGGADEDARLVLGSGQFIPGFEEQLIGSKAGDEKTVKVTFPEEYHANHLAGKDAEFDVVVKEVAAPGAVELNDAFAEKFGLESLDKLKEMVKEQIEGEFGTYTRQKVKRQLLDQLDEQYKFDVPPSLVEQEFDSIWQNVNAELEQAGKTFEDDDTTEEKAREEYTTIAERRVRLGLLMSEIGEKNEVKLEDSEVQRALFAQARNFPGQEQMVVDYYLKNPQAMASIRAPLFEEKVVDYLLEQVSVTDKTVSKDDLMKEDEE
ncbi:trigger factor [Coralliovum pocilloporae]|uniref:trigger factor n=1 Tax=Coralliovum pocilloporae TaxID=3066369 RepID=UPI003306EFAA